jgi:hypothetical protein
VLYQLSYVPADTILGRAPITVSEGRIRR